MRSLLLTALVCVLGQRVDDLAAFVGGQVGRCGDSAAGDVGAVVQPQVLRDPSGLASLAMITTVVPGTVWCELARDSSAVLLHAWNAPDPDAFIAMYKERYERPLIQIFESTP